MNNKQLFQNYRLRLIVWLLVGFFGIFTADIALLARHDRPTSPPLSIHCVGEKADNFACYKERYREFTKAFGVGVAFRDMHLAYDKNVFVHSQCHQLTHIIGNAAAENAADISDAFTAGDSLCWSGYYHGVVEEYVLLRGKEDFRKNADLLCSKIDDKASYGFNYYNCVHGLGHGVMAMTKNQLFEALDLCQSLTPSWEKKSCYGGVFMENIMADSRDHYAAFLKPDDLLYPCNAVGEEYKEECYKMQTSYALTKNGYDFRQLFLLCLGAEEGYRHTCARSIGRDASGQSVSNQAQTIASCMLATNVEQESDCYVGAAKDYVSYFHSDIEARALCFAIPEQFQSTCESALLEQWATVKPK